MRIGRRGSVFIYHFGELGKFRHLPRSIQKLPVVDDSARTCPDPFIPPILKPIIRGSGCVKWSTMGKPAKSIRRPPNKINSAMAFAHPREENISQVRSMRASATGSGLWSASSRSRFLSNLVFTVAVRARLGRAAEGAFRSRDPSPGAARFNSGSY